MIFLMIFYQWEPYEPRGSRTVLREPEGEVPSGYSTGEGERESRPYPIRFVHI